MAYTIIPIRKSAHDLSGKTFAYLTAIAPVARSEHRDIMWLCICDCGTEVTSKASRLVFNEFTSCGCSSPGHYQTHNMCETREYSTWAKMRERCKNKNSKDYEHYGKRGIKVCTEWEGFECFYKDMGARPEGMSIDRIDNDGDYTKSNCRWATPLQQSQNQTKTINVEYKGKTQCVSEWAREYSIHPSTLHSRITLLGWSFEKSITSSVRTKA